MRPRFIAVFIALLIVPLLVLRGQRAKGPAAEAPAPAPATAPAAAPAEVPAAAEQGAVYLDVRTPEEWAAGHVKGALHIPHDQVAARIAELEGYRDRDLVVYCRTGRRSGLAIDVLRQHGFTRLTNGGGLEEVVRTHALATEAGAPE